jgi:general stress protein 26
MAKATLTYAEVLHEIRRSHFAVLSTTDTTGPASAGITFGVSGSGTTIYVMTRRHLQKTRNIIANPRVSLVIPRPRRMLWLIPPATIQLSGHADVLDWADDEGLQVFSQFLLGRQILRSYRNLYARGESRICFLRITIDPVMHTYMVGTPVWRVRKNMEAGASTVIRPQ